MTIVSLEFALFAALALALHHVLPTRGRTFALLACSYVFCAFLGLAEAAILACVTAVNFALGRRLQSEAERSKAWLWLGIAVNVSVLLLARTLRDGGPAIIAGLSFYSVQAISYLVDSYTGALRTQPGFIPFAVYLGYFPKLLAGPIERPRAFFERLSQPLPVDDRAFGTAATLIIVGMVRKLAIADPLAGLIPAEAFESPLTLAPASRAFALVALGFVIYNDFAGYTSIVRGVSRLFGIELSPNFARPFGAASFAEFWTRWHITLSNWLRDYVYMPLSRSLLRRNPDIRNVPNIVLPSMAAMLVSGLWHGGTLNMMIWGALHGSYLAGERAIAVVRGRRPGQDGGWRRPARIAMVFTLTTTALAFFRMETDVAIRFFIKMFSGLGGATLAARTALLIVPALWLDWMQSRHGEDETFHHWPEFARAALVASALLLCFLMSRSTVGAPFIYQAF